MTRDKMEELAKAAAHSAVVAKYGRIGAFNEKLAVDAFLEAYEYAMKKMQEKQIQTSQTSTQSNDRYHAIKEGTAEFKNGKRL